MRERVARLKQSEGKKVTGRYFEELLGKTEGRKTANNYRRKTRRRIRKSLRQVNHPGATKGNHWATGYRRKNWQS